MRLLAVADAAQVFPPCCLLRIADEIGTGDMVMVSQLAAAQAREKRLCPVGAGAIDAVGRWCTWRMEVEMAPPLNCYATTR